MYGTSFMVFSSKIHGFLKEDKEIIQDMYIYSAVHVCVKNPVFVLKEKTKKIWVMEMEIILYGSHDDYDIFIKGQEMLLYAL